MKWVTPECQEIKLGADSRYVNTDPGEALLEAPAGFAAPLGNRMTQKDRTPQRDHIASRVRRAARR